MPKSLKPVDSADPMRPKLLVSESRDFSGIALDQLKNTYRVEMLNAERSELLKHLSDVHVLWVRLRNHIDREIMEAAPKLRAIVSPTTGLNHIDIPEAVKRGIEVVSLRGETEFLRNVRATAELTIGIMLAAMRRIPSAVEHVKRGGWDRDRFKGNELAGKRVGIFGHGRLGRLVCGYLQAFGCIVAASDPKPVEPADVPLMGLHDLLEWSDIVSLHVNLCEATEGFFNAGCFQRMQPGSWIINTSRGELIDEEALLAALASNRLSGAALDVLSNEKADGMATHKLVKYAADHENLIITPHIGGATVESMANTERFMAEKIIRLQPELFASGSHY